MSIRRGIVGVMSLAVASLPCWRRVSPWRTQRGGADELFLTVGALFGPFPVTERVGIVLGTGCQFAVAPPVRLEPALTPEYQNNIIFSARIVF